MMETANDESGPLELVNAVGSGRLGREFDLETVAASLGDTAEYDPEQYPAIYIHLTPSAPLITLYRTGKYIITGATSVADLHSYREEFLQTLSRHNIVINEDEERFRVQNLVFSSTLNQTLNLRAAAVNLGLNRTEYEPEQFPGLIYRPKNHDLVILVFGSGRVIMTGTSSKTTAIDALSNLSTQVTSI